MMQMLRQPTQGSVEGIKWWMSNVVPGEHLHWCSWESSLQVVKRWREQSWHLVQRRLSEVEESFETSTKSSCTSTTTNTGSCSSKAV